MSDKSDVKISKMEIQLPDGKIHLSMDSARKLYEALTELFGKKVVEVEKHHYHDHYLNDWWYRPYRWYSGTEIISNTGDSTSEAFSVNDSVLCFSVNETK